MNKKMIIAAFLIGFVGASNAQEDVFETICLACNAAEGVSAALETMATASGDEVTVDLIKLFRHNFMNKTSQIRVICNEYNNVQKLKKQCEDDYTNKSLSRFFPKPQVCLEYESALEIYTKLKEEYDPESYTKLNRIFSKQTNQSNTK